MIEDSIGCIFFVAYYRTVKKMFTKSVGPRSLINIYIYKLYLPHNRLYMHLYMHNLIIEPSFSMY